MRTEELLALGVFGGGSQLAERVELLLERGRVFSPGASRARVVMGTVVLLGLVIAGSVAPRLIAFAQDGLTFDVASVKTVKPEAHGEPSIEVSPVGVTMRSKNLTGLLMWAYRIEEANQISGPDWIRTDDFDITAKAAGPVSVDDLRLMLHALLEERFKLATHWEQKVVPLYSLVVDKNGPKMREVQVEPRQGMGLGLGDGVITCQLVNHISQLAQILPMFLDGRTVLDKTGLPGVYEFTLKVELDADQMKRMPQAGMAFAGFGYASGVFSAVEQLGLKLEASKGPVDFLVVDHVEKPDAN
jgi:uncharacterized protein (TIGR03435 family)